MTALEAIPTTSEAPAQARPSAVVARLRGYRPNRRTVLRALFVGAAAATLVPFDWYFTRREASAAAAGNKSEYGTCKPASYDEEANNWHEGGEAVCYGGWKRGSFPCDAGYHREGTYSDAGVDYESTRLATNCHGRNAWRWKSYRCSDAVTTGTFPDGSDYTGVTIAACTLTQQEIAHPIPEEPDDPDPSDDASDDDGGDGDDDAPQSDSLLHPLTG
jgi:hypothetical protein